MRSTKMSDENMHMKGSEYLCAHSTCFLDCVSSIPRLRYMNALRNSGVTPNLSPDSEYSPSDSCSMSIHTQSSSSSAGSGAMSVSEYPASPVSRERYFISKFRKRSASKADIRPSSNEGFHRDLARAEMDASLHYDSYDPKDYRDDFLDFTSDTDRGR